MSGFAVTAVTGGYRYTDGCGCGLDTIGFAQMRPLDRAIIWPVPAGFRALLDRYAGKTRCLHCVPPLLASDGAITAADS